MIAACAPNKYHSTPRSRMAAARAVRRSLTAWGLDTAKALGHPNMHGEIVAAIRIRGPAIMESACVVSQFVADLQSLRRRHLLLLCSPTAPLRRRDGRPVPGERRPGCPLSSSSQNSEVRAEVGESRLADSEWTRICARRRGAAGPVDGTLVFRDYGQVTCVHVPQQKL